MQPPEVLKDLNLSLFNINKARDMRTHFFV